jgi:hypothetical protein
MIKLPEILLAHWSVELQRYELFIGDRQLPLSDKDCLVILTELGWLK